MAYSDDITQLYQQQYGRAPDANELNYHLNAFNSGQANAQSLVASLQANQQPAAAPSPVAAPASIPEWQQLNNARDAGAQSAGYSDWNSWYQANPMQASMSGINDAFKQTGQDAYFSNPNANVQAFGGYTKGADGSLVAPGAGVASYNSAVNPTYGGTGPKDLQNIIASASGIPQIAAAAPAQTGATAASGTPSWFTGANQWLSSGQTGTTGGSYYDQTTNKYIMPVFGQGGYDSATGDYSSGALTGWNAYDRLPGNNSQDYSNTPFTSFDATGKEIGSGRFGDIGKTDGIQTAALIGLALGGGAVLGNAVGLIGAPGAGGTGAAAGGGTTGLTGSGLDAALQAASKEALAAYGGAGQAAVNQVSAILSMGGTLSATDVAGIVAATGLTGKEASDLTAKILADTGIASALGGGINSGGNKAGTGTGNVTINNNAGSGLDIAGILAGLYGSMAQNKAAGEQRAWLDKQMSDIDKLYAPGSPEYELMKQEMERKDAAAGRNSQYGVRATDLAAKIAEIKARNKANLAGSTQGNVMSSITADNTSLNSLIAALGKSGPSVQNLSSLLDLFK